MKNKKSQAWGIDLMVGAGIFLVALFIFFIYSVNQSGEARDIIDDLNYNGRTISDDILSEGFPKNWWELENIDGIKKIGILENNKISEDKLNRFCELSRENYQDTRGIFNTKYNYWFFWKGMDITDFDCQYGIGKNPEGEDVKNLIKISRYSVYDNKPVAVYVYIWD